MSDDVDRIRIGYDEGELMGVPAADRANRAIVMTIRDAVDRLVSLGWDRDRDVEIVPENDDGLPYLRLRGRRVFDVRFESLYVDPSETEEVRSRLTITGRWIGTVRGPGPLLRTWRRVLRRA